MCFQTKVDFPPCGHSVDTFIELCGEAWRRGGEPCEDCPSDCIQVYHHDCWECDPSNAPSEKAEISQREQNKLHELEQRNDARMKLMSNMRTIDRRGHQEAVNQVQGGVSVQELPSQGEHPDSREEHVDSHANADSPTYTQPLRNVSFNETVHVHPPQNFHTGSTDDGDREPSHLPDSTHAPSEPHTSEEDDDLEAALAASRESHEAHQAMQRTRSEEAEAAEEEALEHALHASAQDHWDHQRHHANSLSDAELDEHLRKSAAEYDASHEAHDEDELIRAMAASNLTYEERKKHEDLAGDDETVWRVLRESAEMPQYGLGPPYEGTGDNEGYHQALSENRHNAERDALRSHRSHLPGPSGFDDDRGSNPPASPNAAAVREARINALSRGRRESPDENAKGPSPEGTPTVSNPRTYKTLPPPGSTRPLPPPASGSRRNEPDAVQTTSLPPVYATVDLSQSNTRRSDDPWWRDELDEQRARAQGKGKGRKPDYGPLGG